MRAILRFVQQERTMKLWTLILLFGVCLPHWTTAATLNRPNCSVNIDRGVLKSVIDESREIDLSHLGIMEIDEKAFDNLTNVESLNLAHNELEKLPPLIFSKLKNLKTLSLADNNIGTLDRNFVGLDNLKSLDLSNNFIVHLTRGDLFGLTKSTNITVQGNDLGVVTSNTFKDPSSFNPEIPDIKHLGFVRLDYWKDEEAFHVIEVPEHFAVKICKTDDGFVESVEEIKQAEVIYPCTSLPMNVDIGTLDLRGLRLKGFASGWYKLPGDFINTLDLSENDISEITAELLNNLPSNLSSINLGTNQIGVIRAGIIDNIHIKTLCLAKNFITTIEDGAFEKTRLTSISLEYNNLKSSGFARTLPTTIEQLELQKNDIFEIPENSFVNLESLEFLKLSHNHITDLPLNTFRKLTKLYALDLSRNSLERIEPGTFKYQKNLAFLSLAENKISELNSGMFDGLEMLQYIKLNNNKIKKISRDSFANFKNGSGYYFCLWSNQIDTIEEGSFANMDINELQISMNKITERSIAKGAFNSTIVRELYLHDNMMTKINGDAFYGILESYVIHLGRNQIESIQKGDAKYMGNVDKLNLSENPVKYFENGALYGIRPEKITNLVLHGTPVEVIQGGVFDDV